ncbi:CgeB family protein [Sinomonas flava]|uniref:CgeB family protein n=1 Tax=Sinomonas flava TaxID=496857 RepID=UPI0031E0EF05
MKGDQFGSDWWEALSESGVPHVTWFYDELRRMRYSAEQLSVVGPIATYSACDVRTLAASGITVTHVPLGFDALADVVDRSHEGISFVGARYPGREATLRRLVAAGVTVKAFGRGWSRRPLDIIRSGQFRHPGVASGPQLDRSESYGLMKASAATLNLHGDQDGFTMRTFEAPGVGAVHICDRQDVAMHYEIGAETLVFSTEEELAEICHRVLADPVWAGSIRERGRKRTLAEHTLVHRMRTLETLWA